MKKYKVILIIFMLIYPLIGCSTTTANNDSPQAMLKNNPNADFFIMDNTVYANAGDIDWVKQLTLKEGKILGRINKTGVKKGFKDWNATILDVNTAIYEFEDRKDLVVIKIDGKYIPYLKYVEG